jgi:hypothetical protein
MRDWELFGLDTLESVMLGEGPKDQPLELRGGPKVFNDDFGDHCGKVLFLRPEQLVLLYERFKAANPKGIIIGQMFSFDKYAPPGLTGDELEKLEEDRKIFVNIFLTDSAQGYPHARKYLPELFEPGVIEQMVADPWLDVRLLGKAKEQGFVPMGMGDGARWSPEWRAYCDRLIASGEYE